MKMSCLHYIGVPFELEEGTYYEDYDYKKDILWVDRRCVLIRPGARFIPKDNEAFISFETDKNPSVRIGQRCYKDQSFSYIFEHDYIYMLSSDLTDLVWEDDMSDTDIRYLGALYDYLDGILEKGESAE